MMRRTVAVMRIVFLGVALLAGVSGCGSDSSSAPAPDPAPSISSFVANNTTLTAGDSARLTAVFNGSGSVDHGIGAVSSGAAVTVSPTDTTIYTLTVTDDEGGSVTAQLTVTVVPPPAIVAFATTNSAITAGESATLTAEFTDGSGSVNQGVGAVVSGNGAGVTPAATTTYTLTVTNAAGTSVMAQLTVTVMPAPVIASFVASAGTVTAGDSVNLTAVFANGTGSVNPGVGAVVSEGAVAVAPATTTVYTLTVTNSLGSSVSMQVTVTVVPPPTINSFTVSNSTITAGDSTTLTANFANGTGSVNQGVGAVVSGNGKNVTPSATAIYTLTVTNAAGTSVTAQLTVTVIPAPVVTSFVAGTGTITVGNSTTLTAVFADGTGSVNQSVGSVVSGNAVTVTPATTTTYTLTVTNAAGASVMAQVTVTVVPLPSITSFTSGGSTITAGSSTSLTAVFANGTGSVNQSVGSVVSGNAVTVTPAATTTYTLTVTNAAGASVMAQVTVTVVAAPVITSFTVSDNLITVGDSVVLTAVFANGNGSVDGGVGTVTSAVGENVSPAGTTTYVLTVTNAAGTSVTDEVTVTVAAVPAIASFSAASSTIPTGGSTTLTAVYSNGNGSVDNGVGTVASGVAVTVSPAATTIYTLTVTNVAGRSVTAQTTVSVAPPLFSFLAYGDSRADADCSGNAVHISLVERMRNIAADFVVHLGDMITGYNSNSNWTSDGDCTTPGSRGSFRDIIAPLQNKTPAAGLPAYFLPVVGNHDDSWGEGWYPDAFNGGFCDVFDPVPLVPNHTQQPYFVGTTVPRYTDTEFYNLACSKTNQAVYPDFMYYSFNHQNTHFVVLRVNSDYFNLEVCNNCADRSDYQDYYAIHQLDWLRADLAAASVNPGVEHIIVFLHAPVFTTSYGHNANESWQLLSSEFTKYGVDMVFSGHNHVYERTVPISVTPLSPDGIRDDTGGTVYIVTGGGGSDLHGFDGNAWYMETSSAEFHYVKIDVFDNRIGVTAVRPDGTVIDSFSR